MAAVEEVEIKRPKDAAARVTEALVCQLALDSTHVLLAVLAVFAVLRVAAAQGGEPDAEIPVHRHQAKLRDSLANYRVTPAVAGRRALAVEAPEPRAEEVQVLRRKCLSQVFLVLSREAVRLPARAWAGLVVWSVTGREP